MSKSLEGIRVLDLGRIVAAPWCTQTLGDLGAEIIKIERPGRGDDLRSYGPVFARDDAGNPTQESGHFICSNRNKRSVAVDISRPEGQEIVRRLAMDCDVLIENFKVGDLKRYGLDYDSLKALNPRLIYCSITGFGQDGPYRDRPGYDAVFQGMSGMMAVTGDPAGEPQRVGVFVVDQMTGLYAAVAILAALRARDAGLGGQYIDLSLLDVSVAIMAPRNIEWTLGGKVPDRLGTKSPGSAPAQVFACADGYLNIQAGAEADFRKLCGVLELDHLPADPRFESRPRRVENQEDLARILGDAIAGWPVRALADALVAVGVVASPIYRADQVVEDPQVRHRELFFDVAHPTVGTVPLVASPLRMSGTPVEAYAPPPTVGQHTDGVLARMLGYSDSQLAALRAAGVI